MTLFGIFTIVANAQPQETHVSSEGSLVMGLFTALSDGYAVTNKVDLEESVVLVLKQTNGQWMIVDKLVGDADANSLDPQPFHSGDMRGDRVVLGDPDFSQPTAVNAGTVYFYKLINGDWVREGRVVASDFDGNDGFGASVSIHGDVAIAGAPGDDDNGNKSGSAYIMRFDGTTWSEEAKLLPTVGFENAAFGTSVAIYGDYAVVGVLIDSEADALAGAAYVFKYDGASWAQVAKLFPSDPTIVGTFGIDVDMEEDRIIIGAHGATGITTSTGAAYIFEKQNDLWIETAKLFSVNTNSGAFFGNSVALDGNCAAIGAFNEDSATGGAAYTFVYVDGGWQEAYKIQAGENAPSNLFGNEIAVSDGSVFVAAPGANTGTAAGAAFIYDNVCAPTATSNEVAEVVLPDAPLLGINYPNPFQFSTTVPVTLTAPAYVEMKLYDLLGREVDTLITGQLAEGEHRAAVDADKLVAGIYIIKLQVDEQRFFQQIVYAP